MEPADASNGATRTFAQLRRGVLEPCVLAVLAEGERYGFELVGELAQAGGLTVSEGTIYPLLSRLRRNGLVETRWVESPAGPPRRYYRLSASGRRSLHAFRQDWVAFRDAVDRFIVSEELP